MTAPPTDNPQRARIWRNARLATLSAARPGIGAVENGAVVVDEEHIVFAGPEADMPSPAGAEVIDCEGRWITPGLIDCHTHLVYAGHAQGISNCA